MTLVAPSDSQTPVPAERDLHHVLREVAHRMQHVLVRGRDAAGRGVVVGAEMRGDDPAAAFGDEPRQRDAAVGREDRLRRLDHQLEPQRARRQLAPVFERVARGGERGDLFRRGRPWAA